MQGTNFGFTAGANDGGPGKLTKQFLKNNH